MAQKVRIKLKSFDHTLVDQSAERIVEDCKKIQVQLLVVLFHYQHKKSFYSITFPHVNKQAREQFQLANHKRLMDIYSSSSKTIDALMKLELPSGVHVEIKVI